MILVAIVLGGAGLASFLAPPEDRAAFRLHCALAAVLGLGLTGAISMAGRLLQAPSWIAHLVVSALGAAGLLLSRGRGLRRPVGDLRRKSDLCPRIFTLLAAAVVGGLFLEHSIRYPDGAWDARAIWNLRARALHRAPHRLDLALPAAMPETHPDYPLLLPSLVADGYAAMGETPAVQVGLAAVFTLLLVLVPALAAARVSAERGFLAALAMLGMPALLQQGWSQQADVPVAVFLSASAALWLEGSPLLAGLAVGFCALTKNEGLFWAAVLWVSLPGRRRFALGAALPLLLVVLFKLGFPHPSDLISGAAFDLRRGLVLGKALVAELWNFPAFGLAGPAVLIALVALRGDDFARPLKLALLSALAVLCTIYLTAPRPIEQITSGSLDRLLLQWSGVAVLAAVRWRRGTPRWSGTRSAT